MNDWVVESPSFEEQLINNRIVYLNQKGINEVVELIKNKDKEIEKLNNIINKLEKWLESEIQRLEKIQNSKKGVKPYGQEYNNLTLLIGAYDNALDELRELKGSDKEWIKNI